MSCIVFEVTYMGGLTATIEPLCTVVAPTPADFNADFNADFLIGKVEALPNK